MADLTRLADRVDKLKSHFAMAQKDIDEIVISTNKMARHGDRINMLDLRSATEAEEQ